MRVKVIREFIDIHTKQAYEIGELLTVSKARYAEIQKAGKFVVPAEIPKKEKENHEHEISGTES